MIGIARLAFQHGGADRPAFPRPIEYARAKAGRGENRGAIAARHADVAAHAMRAADEEAGAFQHVEFGIQIIEAGAHRQFGAEHLVDPGFIEFDRRGARFDAADHLDVTDQRRDGVAIIVDAVDMHLRPAPAQHILQIQFGDDIEIVEIARPLLDAAADDPHDVADIGDVDQDRTMSRLLFAGMDMRVNLDRRVDGGAGHRCRRIQRRVGGRERCAGRKEKRGPDHRRTLSARRGTGAG
jgi:hypothetical protein